MLQAVSSSDTLFSVVVKCTKYRNRSCPFFENLPSYKILDPILTLKRRWALNSKYCPGRMGYKFIAPLNALTTARCTEVLSSVFTFHIHTPALLSYHWHWYECGVHSGNT